MKKAMLFILLVSSVFANAQSIKEALYGGKLKNQNGTVVRKGDDLTPKIDTTSSKTPINDSTKTKDTTLLTVDSLMKKPNNTGDSAVVAALGKKDTTTALPDTTVVSADAAKISKENSTASKDNNVLWKEYVNTVTTTLKTEVLPSKKIKRGSYYITVSYVIDTTGQVGINNVSVTPDNAFLQQQVKDRLTVDTPRMSPVMSSSGTPRKVNKNYNFTLSKD
jgi:hypothetical protein